MGTATIRLRTGETISNPEKVLTRYLQRMGKGIHTYDVTKLPEDDFFPADQIETALGLINKLGARAPTKKILPKLRMKQSEIEQKLSHVPAELTIFHNYDEIPWDQLEQLFSTFQVPYMGISRCSKLLHKKRPSLIPLLDSVATAYLDSLSAPTTRSFSKKAARYIREFKEDMDSNRKSLIALQEWNGNLYSVSTLRIFDILLWCTRGPFKEVISAV